MKAERHVKKCVVHNKMFPYYLLAITSILVYLHGFFPVPNTKFGFSSESTGSNHASHILPAKFEKAVIIIIDALRLDFVSPQLMPFTSDTHNTNGCFINLKVETPTVTLPRIKALTSGSVPQFIDILFNLAYTGALEDSFVHRAVGKGKEVVFYGDDTWLKLFPSQFKRSEGTSSFYVNDFWEVDDNVTRNVKQELTQKDWDIMILHYLGLDHIGHVLGPRSHLVPRKLQEMDDIIKEIYSNTVAKGEATIVIVTGDHGMKDSGGHGGSTYAETNVPFVVLGNQCNDDSFFQIDIPANIAVLLGLDIPRTSIGQVRSSLLASLATADYLHALKYNTLLLRNKTDICGDDFHMAERLHDLFLINNDTEHGLNATKIYEECSRVISHALIQSSVTQNIYSLVIAVTVMMYVLLKSVQSAAVSDVTTLYENIELILVFAILTSQPFNFDGNLSLVLVTVVSVLIVKSIVQFKKRISTTAGKSFLVATSIVHPLTFASSSYIEEEHQFWYFMCTTFLIVNLVRDCQKSLSFCCLWLPLLVGIRFIRTINQTGDQWASLPDFSDWLLKSENHFCLQIFYIVSLILVLLCFDFNSNRQGLDLTTNAFIFILIYIFRSLVNENVTLGATIWILIFTKGLYYLITGSGPHLVWLLIISLLLKPHNVILIPACVFASRFIHSKFKDTTTLTLVHLWLGNMLFFAQGHCNSLASIDISSGYVGLNHYQPLLVALQVISHTYALPGLSHLLLMTNVKINRQQAFYICLIYRLYVILIVFLITFIQRHHLFIWSVFAPKMFVESSHFCFLFIEVCCYYLSSIVNKKIKLLNN